MEVEIRQWKIYYWSVVGCMGQTQVIRALRNAVYDNEKKKTNVTSKLPLC